MATQNVSETDAQQRANSAAKVKPVGSSLRNPDYPVTDIEEAIDRLKKVYQTIRTGTQSYEVVAKSMGYKGISGASRVMIATLKKFSLLEESGKDALRITEVAKAIAMLQPNDPRFVEAVKQCGLKPVVFADLYSTYQLDLPDDNSLRFLLVGKKFTPEVAAEVVKSYRRTLDYLRRLDPQMTVDVEAVNEETPQEELVPPKVSVAKATPQEPGRKAANVDAPVADVTAELHITLPGSCKAHVTFEGRVTKESVERLRDYLAFFAEDQPNLAAQRPIIEQQPIGKSAPDLNDESIALNEEE